MKTTILSILTLLSIVISLKADENSSAEPFNTACSPDLVYGNLVYKFNAVKDKTPQMIAVASTLKSGAGVPMEIAQLNVDLRMLVYLRLAVLKYAKEGKVILTDTLDDPIYVDPSVVDALMVNINTWAAKVKFCLVPLPIK